MKPADMPNMILYTVAYVLEGCGTEAAQRVLASSIESALVMFTVANPTAHITFVSVGDRTVMYEDEANEVTKTESA